MQIILDHLGGPNVLLRVLRRGRGAGGSVKKGGRTVEVETGRCWLLALKTEEGATGNECRQPLEARKDKKPDSLLASPGGLQPS